jgi:chaperonin GroES
VKVIGDRILVRPEPVASQTTSGLMLNTANERPRKGEVLSVGEMVSGIATGDRILFGKLAGTRIEENGEDYLVIRKDEVMLIL